MMHISHLGGDVGLMHAGSLVLVSIEAMVPEVVDV